MKGKILPFSNSAIYGTIKLEQTETFAYWMGSLDPPTRGLVWERLIRIADFGHFGDFKHLGNGLLELKWRNGVRIYFSKKGSSVLLLLGGTKHGQKKDIKKAHSLMERYSGG